MIKRQEAIIGSMTRLEQRKPDVLNASRKRRVAAGAGVEVQEINRLLKQHRQMSDMMKAMGSGKRGPLAGIAQAMGFGGGMPIARTDEGDGRENAARRLTAGGMPALPKELPAGLRTGLPNLPGLTGLPQQADAAGPRRLSRIGEEEMTLPSFRRCEAQTGIRDLRCAIAHRVRSLRMTNQ